MEFGWTFQNGHEQILKINFLAFACQMDVIKAYNY